MSIKNHIKTSPKKKSTLKKSSLKNVSVAGSAPSPRGVNLQIVGLLNSLLGWDVAGAGHPE